MLASEPPRGSAADLLRQWQRAIKDRDAEVKRAMACETLGIEANIALLRADVDQTVWFVGRLIRLLAARESEPNEKDEPQARTP